MLIPVEELKLLYERAIANVTDSPPRPLLSAERYQGGFGFIRNDAEYRLAFDALEAPECMTLQTNLEFIKAAPASRPCVGSSLSSTRRRRA